MGGGAGGRIAGDKRSRTDVGWMKIRRNIRLSFAEYAFKRGTRRPDEIAACVHVEVDGSRWVLAKGEREEVIAAGGERQRDFPAMPLPPESTTRMKR